MNLYERDYFQLTKKESRLIERLKLKEGKWGVISAKDMLSIPKAYYFHASEFPNNKLDTDQLKDKNSLKHVKSFSKLVGKSDITEQHIQSFIKSTKSFFLIASVLGYYDFGHHGGFLFPELPLSTNHVVDYLIIGKNSGGYEFIFVELEAVNGSIVTKEGAIGETVRKGIKQVEDWDYWLQKNYSSLKPFYDKYRNEQKTLPDEFLEFDRSRIHYVVVAGKRKDYNQMIYRKRRSLLKDNNIRLLHYDNLVDAVSAVVKAGNYCRSI